MYRKELKLFHFLHLSDSVIDTNTLKHLMAASSFGYGLFQLTTSLLPAKLLKIISIFGFEGNRDIGVSCLTYARSSSDMRATLATFVFLSNLLSFLSIFFIHFRHNCLPLVSQLNRSFCFIFFFFFFPIRIFSISLSGDQ